MKVLCLSLLVFVVCVFTAAAGGTGSGPSMSFSSELDTGWEAVLSGGTGEFSLYDTLFTLDIGFTSPDRMFGLIGGFEADLLQPSATLAANFSHAELWGKFLGGALILKGGLLNDTVWETKNEEWGSFDKQLGFELQLAPTKAMNFGVYVPVVAPVASIPTVWTALQGTGYGFSYSNSAVGSIVGGVLLSPTASANYGWFGVDLGAIPKMSIQAEGQFVNIGNKTSGEYDFTERVYYNILDPLKIGILLFQNLYLTNGSALGQEYEPELALTLGIFELKLKGAYTLSSDQGVTVAAPGVKLEPEIYLKFNSNAEIKLVGEYKVGDLHAPSTS